MQGRARRPKWWRVAHPTPDWRAEDWAFSDADDGVTVVELRLQHGPQVRRGCGPGRDAWAGRA